VNVLDILTEIINSLNRRLTHESVRVMHIPESCYLTVADLVEDLFKSLCISIYAVCLNKECYIIFFCVRNELSNDGDNDIIVYLLLRCRITVTQNTDIRCAELGCKLDISLDLSDCLVLCGKIVYRLA